MTVPLQFTPGDETWQRLRQKALTDLFWFAGVVLKYGDRVGMTEGVHRLLCRFAEHRLGIPAIDEAKYRKIEMPRGTGKSTLITQALTIQRICQNPDISIMLANENVTNATSFLSEIKAQFESNDFLRALFPEVLPDIQKTKWSTEEIVMQRTSSRKEATVFCVGVGGTKTGMHPDLIIVDDMISREAAENARVGGDMQGKLNRWITQLVPLLNAWAEPRPEIIFIGTRWYNGDSYEWLEEAFGYGEQPQTWTVQLKLPDNQMQSLPVYRVGDIAVFRRSAIENGTTIWPENPGFTLESLAKMRVVDPTLFAANMLNRPADDLTATFKGSWIQPYDWLDPNTVHFIDGQAKKRLLKPTDLDTVMLVDPGGFKERVADDRARAAIIVTGSTGTGEHLLLEAWSEPVSFLIAIDKILELGVRYRVRKVYVEIAGQQLAFYELLKRVARERKISLVFDTVKPEGRVKEARILGLEPYFQRGQIFVGTGPSFMEFRQQYQEFPRARRKDLLDVLAYGPSVWRSTSGAQQSPEQRQTMERTQLRIRMGQR